MIADVTARTRRDGHGRFGCRHVGAAPLAEPVLTEHDRVVTRGPDQPARHAPPIADPRVNTRQIQRLDPLRAVAQLAGRSRRQIVSALRFLSRHHRGKMAGGDGNLLQPEGGVKPPLVVTVVSRLR